MSLTFEMCVEERQPTRVVVTVHLAPEAPDFHVDGLSVQLFGPGGERLSSKVLLPVSGALVGPLASRVEVRTDGRELPSGSQVVATAWWGDEQRRVRRSTDAGTTVVAYVRPENVPVVVRGDDVLLELIDGELDVMRALFPGLSRPRPRPVLDAPTAPEDLAADLGLDPDEAEWLAHLADDDDA